MEMSGGGVFASIFASDGDSGGRMELVVGICMKSNTSSVSSLGPHFLESASEESFCERSSMARYAGEEEHGLRAGQMK